MSQNSDRGRSQLRGRSAGQSGSPQGGGLASFLGLGPRSRSPASYVSPSSDSRARRPSPPRRHAGAPQPPARERKASPSDLAAFAALAVADDRRTPPVSVSSHRNNPGSGSGSSVSSSGASSGASSDSWQPTVSAAARPGNGAYRSAFFSAGDSSSGSSASASSSSSSSSSSPGDPASLSTHRAALGRQASASSSGSDIFARGSGGEDSVRSRSSSGSSAAGSPPNAAGSARCRQQIHSTSFKSGFSDQMYTDSDGQERFLPGSPLKQRYDAYKAAGDRAVHASHLYRQRQDDVPNRRRALDGPNAAYGKDLGLPKNLTVEEHRELRRMAHTVFAHAREETRGRESFNRDYRTVWEKRSLQTGVDSVKNHANAADKARKNAGKWLTRRETHAEAMEIMGVPRANITPMSTWGSVSSKEQDTVAG